MMKNNKSRGFSLVEAMLVVAIIGVLVAMAVPSYHDMIERNRLKQAIETLKSDLQYNEKTNRL
jgi:type IV fimbrial biogenesis protein FimT